MKRYIPIILVMLFWCPLAHAQASWPANKVKFSNGEWLQDKRDEHPFYTQDALPTCASPTWGLTIYISDGTDASDCAVGTPGSVTAACFCDDNDQWTSHNSGGGGGAPTSVDYLVGTANGTLTNEIVVGTAPGGELGGTWGSPTVDSVHAGSAHHAEVTSLRLDQITNQTGNVSLALDNGEQITLTKTDSGGAGSVLALEQYRTGGTAAFDGFWLGCDNEATPGPTLDCMNMNIYPSAGDYDFTTGLHISYQEDIAALGNAVTISSQFGGPITTALNVSDSDIVDAINIGANNFATAVTQIASTAFDAVFGGAASDADSHHTHPALNHTPFTMTVNASDANAKDWNDARTFQIVQCTGAGTPHISCPASGDLIGVIPEFDSHTHNDRDITSNKFPDCTNLYDNCTNCTQTSGSPDLLCDSDGVTYVGYYSCADKWDTPVPVFLDGPGGIQNSCADGEIWCSDGWCDSFPIRALSLFKYYYNEPPPSYSLFVDDPTINATAAAMNARTYMLDGSSGPTEGFRVELDVEDLDVNDLTDSLTDPNTASAVVKFSATPSTINFAYPAIINTRNETNPAHVGNAFVHYVTKVAGVTDKALNVEHAKIDVALAMGDNTITTRCDDVYDSGGPPQNACVGGANNYDDIVGCPDTYCDDDGTTSAPDQETFAAADIETVMLGASKDNADAQHIHSMPPVCAYIEDPVTDEVLNTVWRAPFAVTVTEIWCETDAGTVGLDLDIDDGTPAGINGSDISCASTGTSDTSFAGSASLADGDRIDINLGTVTTAVRLSVCFEYTVD